MEKATLFGAAMLAVSMITVSAQAGPPAPFENCDFYADQDEAFKAVCAANLELKAGQHYMNSCADDGGRCDDSVDNKLQSALDKYLKGKSDDALMATCAIYNDADKWAGSPKPKLTQTGFDYLTVAVDALANHIQVGAKCSP